jgi:uncharacterized protein YciI
MKYYVFKLIAPRANFISTMTPAELELMQRHGAYLNSWMARGNIVVYGPVLDPAGAYGLAVVRLEAGVDPASIWMDDPVIKSQTGFRYEIAAMAAAVVPQ